MRGRWKRFLFPEDLHLRVSPLYRGTSRIRNSPPIGLYKINMPRALCWSLGVSPVSYERGTPVCQQPHQLRTTLNTNY